MIYGKEEEVKEEQILNERKARRNLASGKYEVKAAYIISLKGRISERL